MRSSPGSLALWLALLFAFAGLAAPGRVAAQEVLKIDPDFVCGAQPMEIPSEVYLFRATQGAEEVIRGLVDYLGLSGSKIELRASNVKNALAYVDPLTQGRLILYNESFVQELKEKSRSLWVQRAVLAHELAHHLENHLQDARPERRSIEELEADRFAGHILFKLDADLEAVTRVFEELEEGKPYPPRSARVAAAVNGWYSAQEQSAYVPDRTGDLRTASEVPAPRPVPVPAPPSRSEVRLLVEQSPAVIHAGGLPGGPGLELRLQGTVDVPRPGLLGVLVSFWFDDGRILFPHPQEFRYRDAAQRLATGSMGRNVGAGPIDLAILPVDPIPHYALNLIPTGYRTHYRILATAQVLLDDVPLAESPPTEFLVQW